jgi:membrane fusion protein (multidrug efflux system)
MMTTVIRSIILLILIPLVGCGAPEEESVVETKPRAVRVETIVSRDLPIVVNAVGRLLPNREVTLSAEVGGIVMQYSADVGSAVDEAAILVHIDRADYELALKEAEANLRAAEIRLPVTQKSYERAQELLPDNVITQERYDQAEAAYESAKALVDQLKTTVALARRRLEKTTIKAPFDGYVTQRFVEMGQNIAMGDEPVMRLRRRRDRIHADL